MTWGTEVLERIALRYCGWEGMSAEDAKYFADAEWFRRDDRWRTNAPVRFADATPDDLRDTAREAFEEWRQDGTRNLLIFGPVGTGKTHMAYAIARHAHMCDLPIRATSMVELLIGLRPDGGATLSTFTEPAILLVDDLGAEKLTDWAFEQISAIVDYRWRNKLGTLVTSNLSPAQLKAAIGERAWSRLQDGAVAVTLAGDDRRRVA